MSEDLTVSVGIETTFGEGVTQTQAEGLAPNDFAQAGRFGELHGVPGAAAFDGAAQERLAASRLAASQVQYPSPADRSLYSPASDLLRSGFAPSRQTLDSDTALAAAGIMPPGGFGGGRYGGPGGGGGNFGGGGGNAGGPGPGDFADDGFSYNERWRQYRQGPWHQNLDMGGVEEAQYADIIDTTGRVGPAGFRGRMSEMFGGMREAMTSTDMQFALGFGAMTTASGLQRALSPMVSGDAYLPGQVAQQSATSLAPLIGAIGGTLIGGRFGQPLAGQFIGQAAGQAGEDLFDTYSAGHTFAQQTAGESLAVGRGGRAEAEEFAKALRDVVTPAAKELAEAFQKLGQTGPVAASGAAGLAPFQTEFGTAFAPTVAAEARSLESSPFLAPMRLRFGANAAGIPGSDYLGAAGIMAAAGDYGGMLANVGFAQATAGRDLENPAYRRDRDFVDRYSRTAGAGQDFKDFFTWDGGQQAAYAAAQQRLGNTGPGGEHVPGTGEDQFLSRQDRAKAARISAAATDLQNAYEGHQANEAELQLSGATLGADMSGLQLSLLRGGGAAALGAALPGVLSQVSAGSAAIGRDIAGLRQIQRTSPALGGYAETLIQQEASRRTALETQGAQIGRLGITTALQEDESAFRLGNLRDTLGGLSNAQQAPGDTAYYRRLITDARSLPFLSPGERDQMEAQGLQGAYQTRLGVDAQRLSQIDLRTDQGQTGLTRAGIFGGPQDVFQAGQGVADAFTAKIKELTDELRRGGLTLDDSIAKERQLSETRRSSAQFDFQRQEGRFESQASVIGTDIAAASVGMGRALARGGNAALDPSLLSLDLSAQTVAQSKLDFDTKNYPGNQQLLASDRLGVRQAAERRELALDAYNTYQPTGADARRLMNDEGSFQRSRIAPYSDGSPGSNPFTSGLALLGDYRDDLKALDTNRLQRQAQGVWRDEDETRYTGQRNADLGRIAGLEHDRTSAAFGALPEMIAGLPLGRGVGSAVLPTAAMAALFAPSAANGSFGPLMRDGMPGMGMVRAGTVGGSGSTAAHGVAPTPYHPMAIGWGRDATGHAHSEGYMSHAGLNVDATGRPHSDMSGALLNAHHSAATDLTTGRQVSVAASSFFAPARPTPGMAPPMAAAPPAGPSGFTGGGYGGDEVVRVLRSILSAIERGSRGNSSTPPMNNIGSIQQILGQSRNPYGGR